MEYIQRKQNEIMEKNKEKSPFPYGKDLFIRLFFPLQKNIEYTGKKKKEKWEKNSRC